MVVLIQLYSYMVQAGRRKEKSEESDPQLKQEGRNTSKAGSRRAGATRIKNLQLVRMILNN